MRKYHLHAPHYYGAICQAHPTPGAEHIIMDFAKFHSTVGELHCKKCLANKNYKYTVSKLK
jgi:hypothetical protein